VGALRALDGVASEKCLSERSMHQLASIGDVDVQNANLTFYLSGKCKYSRIEPSNRRTHLGQTSNYNTQRNGPTFHPSTRSDLSFLDRQTKRSRFCLQKKIRQRHGHGRRRCPSNCKNFMEFMLILTSTLFQRSRHRKDENRGHI